MAATGGFPPILGNRPKVLILGTLPSQESIQNQQYYGNPRNAFWSIMEPIISVGPDGSYADRVQAMTAQRLAVWDVLASSIRPGSMDAHIDLRSAIPNDFVSLLRDQPDISLICFNGKTSASLFERLVRSSSPAAFASIDQVTMPSTSPAFAAMDFAEKLRRWSAVLRETLSS